MERFLGCDWQVYTQSYICFLGMAVVLVYCEYDSWDEHRTGVMITAADLQYLGVLMRDVILAKKKKKREKMDDSCIVCVSVSSIKRLRNICTEDADDKTGHELQDRECPGR